MSKSTPTPILDHAPELRVTGNLTAAAAASLCQAVRRKVAAGARRLTVNLVGVERIDAAGIAAALQSVEFTTAHGVELCMKTSPAVDRAFVNAETWYEIMARNLGSLGPSSSVVTIAHHVEDATTLATGARVVLRLPVPADWPCFAEWAADPVLARMVASDLLYRCYLPGSHHQETFRTTLTSPTAVTAIIEPRADRTRPLGFVRLYGINLVQGFAFFEAVVAGRSVVSGRSGPRGGIGVEASRLFLAWALDALQLHRVEAKVFAYNALSINSLKGNGFRQEGILRQARLDGGRRWDVLIFSMIRDELEEQRRNEPFPPMGFWTEPALAPAPPSVAG